LVHTTDVPLINWQLGLGLLAAAAAAADDDDAAADVAAAAIAAAAADVATAVSVDAASAAAVGSVKVGLPAPSFSKVTTLWKTASTYSIARTPAKAAQPAPRILRL